MVPVSGTVLHFATHYLRSEANLIPDECFCFKMHYGRRNLGLVKPKSRLPVEGFIVLSLNKKKKEKKGNLNTRCHPATFLIVLSDICILDFTSHIKQIVP